MQTTNLIVFVDVDDTLVRTVGTKRIPMVSTIEHVRRLKAEGVQLFCWSAGGADYAREVAIDFHLADCFIAFLPKPHVMIDDQPPVEWSRTRLIHPASCTGHSATNYCELLDSSH